MSEPRPQGVEKELLQPRPRQVRADVPDFEAGRHMLTFGVLYVLAWLVLPPLAFSLFIKPAVESPDAAREARAAQARGKELEALKARGVTVEATASVRSVKERYDQENLSYYIEVTDEYTYPGGEGTYTEQLVSPRSKVVVGDPGAETAKMISEIQARPPWKVEVVYLPDSPGVHCLARDLDRELNAFDEQARKESADSRSLFWLMVGVTSPGWVIGLLGLLRMAVTVRQRFFLGEDAGRRRDLARDGVAVQGVVTAVEVRPTPGASRGENQEVHYRFEAPDGVARGGRFAHYVGMDSDRLPVGSAVTVLYDPANPDRFVRYKELRGVRVVPPEAGSGT